MSAVNPEDLVAVIFVLVSLAPAFILFKFLKSTAVVKQKHYQAGGAIAGYLIVLAVLFAFKLNLEGHKEWETKYKDCSANLDTATKMGEARGTVRPVGKWTRVALSIADSPADAAGRFKLDALERQLREGVLYVETESGVQPWIIESNADLQNLTIDLGH